MTAVQGPSLVSLRCLLFFFFGGVGCLLPFLSLHARAVGLSLEEARTVSYAAPLLALLGPIVAGPLLDRFYAKKKQTRDVKFETNSCIRITLSSTILLATIFYSLLLSVPPVERLEPRQPRVSFACSPRGASLLQERCNDHLGCYQYKTEKKGEIRLKSCAFDCSSPAFDARYWEDDSLETEVRTPSTLASQSPTTPLPPSTDTTDTEQPFVLELEPDLDKFFGTEDGAEEEDDDSELGSGEEIASWLRRRRREEEPSPPHICFDASTKRMCSVYTPYSASIRVNISLKQAYEEKDYCFYPLGGHFACQIPVEQQQAGEQCKVVCELEDAFVAGSVLLQSQCQKTIGDPALTFWLYLLFRGLGDLFTSVTISLLIGAVLTAVRVHIGREFLAPSVAYALYTSLVGYLHSPELSPLGLEHLPPYILGIVGFGLLSVLSLFVLIFATEMPIGPPDWWTTTTSVRMRHKAEFCGLLLALTLLGVLWGPHFSHVPWHLAGTPGLQVYVGSSLALGALLSVPFVWKADVVIDFCGYSNILIGAFTFYILRYTGLLFIEIPWVLFITGSLEVFTLSLMVFSAILYVRHLVPKHLTFTAQSLGFAAHFCLGNGLGCLIGTLLSPTELEIQAASAPNGSQTNTTAEVETSPQGVMADDFQSPYHVLYCSGAIFAAVVAAVYFIVYHCCLKKKCLAPNYRKTPAAQPPLVQSPTGNGTYTPLIVFTNGRQQPTAAD